MYACPKYISPYNITDNAKQLRKISPFDLAFKKLSKFTSSSSLMQAWISEAYFPVFFFISQSYNKISPMSKSGRCGRESELLWLDFLPVHENEVFPGFFRDGGPEGLFVVVLRVSHVFVVGSVVLAVYGYEVALVGLVGYEEKFSL